MPIKVEVRSMPIRRAVPWGGTALDVSQDSGFDLVMVNGVQAGYAPSSEKDANYRVFHPLSGFPQALCSEVVASSGGRLKSSLRAPVPQPQPEVEDDEEA